MGALVVTCCHHTTWSFANGRTLLLSNVYAPTISSEKPTNTLPLSTVAIDALTGKLKVAEPRSPGPNRAANTNGDVALSIEESLNDPPILVATDVRSGRKRRLLEINPQLSELQLGKVEAIEWTAQDGVQWCGGLYHPPQYVPGRRYPLVLQTHGFDANRFTLYGAYTTGFAAQPLAAHDVFVLQVKDPPGELSGTPREAPAAQHGYEAAVDHLDRLGLIDRNHVGLVGFSRTCWYVKYTLMHSAYPFAAVSLSHGVDMGYFQYMIVSSGLRKTMEDYIGAVPVGEGLEVWRRESPGFNIDKVNAPVCVVALNPLCLLGEWHFFTGLRSLNKPVELYYIPDGAHELAKPRERLTSSQSGVDWFRFWLKDDEDPDPAKAEQYVRWRELRKLQAGPASTQRPN